MADQEDIERWYRENVEYLNTIRNANSFQDYLRTIYDAQYSFAERSGEGFKRHSAGSWRNAHFTRDLTDEESALIESERPVNPYSHISNLSATYNNISLPWIDESTDSFGLVGSYANQGYFENEVYQRASTAYRDGFYNAGPGYNTYVSNPLLRTTDPYPYETKRILPNEEFNALIDTEEFLLEQEDLRGPLPFLRPEVPTISLGRSEIFGLGDTAIEQFQAIRSATPEELEADLQRQLQHDIESQKSSFIGAVARIGFTAALGYGLGAVGGQFLGSFGGKALAAGVSQLTGGFGTNPNDLSGLSTVAENIGGSLPRNVTASTGISLTQTRHATQDTENYAGNVFAASGNSDVFGEDVVEDQTGGSFLDA